MSNPIFHSQYTAAQIEASIGKSPRINSTTRVWEVWDIATGAYVSTGVVAESAQYAAEAEDYKDLAYAYEQLALAHAGNADAAKTAAEAAAEIAEQAVETLSSYAKVDGYYENMTVGNAEQLVSTVMVNDKVPYLFRTSGGSADIGNREYDTIVGGTVAWNQLVKNGNFESTSNWAPGRCTRTVTDNICTLTSDGTAVFMQIYQDISIPVNHVVFVRYNYDFSDSSSVARTYVSYTDQSSYISVGINSTASGTNAFMFKSTLDISRVQLVFGRSGDNLTQGDTADFSRVNIFDLTAMFGSTIADYIYSIEQSTPGAGAAWFKSLFQKPYYAYNAGELLSVSGLQSHDMTGFNQWDGEWENGGYDADTGEKKTMLGFGRSKNLIPCVSNTQYYFHIEYPNLPYVSALLFYDAEGNFITGTFDNSPVNNTFTTPDNACYMAFYARLTSFDGEICVNLSWSGYRNGEFEQYVKHSYPLDNTLTLRGIPKLDANNALYYDGDTYAADGTVTRRYAVITPTSLISYYANPSTGIMLGVVATDAKIANSNSIIQNVICNNLITYSANSQYSASDGGFVAISNTGNVIVSAPGCTTSQALTTWLTTNHPVIVYELATPTTETADPFQSPQIVDDFGTEQYVVTSQGDVEIPVGHNTNYPANLRDKLQHLPDLSDDGDGRYIIQQSGSNMALIPLTTPTELPAAPSTGGTYTLKCTVADGVATYSWEVE